MIKMVCGATRIGGKIKRPESGYFCADAEAENRLVRLGVAEYAPGAAADAVAPAEKHIYEAELAEAEIDPGQLAGMKMQELKELARDMGVDITGMKSKAEIARAISETDVIPGDVLTEETEAPTI